MTADLDGLQPSFSLVQQFFFRPWAFVMHANLYGYVLTPELSFLWGIQIHFQSVNTDDTVVGQKTSCVLK